MTKKKSSHARHSESPLPIGTARPRARRGAALQPGLIPLQVGAWSFFSATERPADTLAACRRRGVTFLDIMINDASKDHLTRVAFHMFDQDQLARAADHWRKNGLGFGVTTWITPRATWIDGMAKVGKLAASIGAESITLDAEEPWIVPQKQTPVDTIRVRANEAVAHLRRTSNARIGVTHIVYADKRVIGPLLDLADEDTPQCYATVGNAKGLKPGGLERTTVTRWARKGEAELPFVMGVAGWKQEGAYGLAYLDAFRASLRTSRELGIERCRVWRLDAIDDAEAKVLREAWV